ncbi:hypothetical protein GCM10022211_09110 [Sphingomonas humi]|uniref:Glycosyltransferase 2-like domain-containing protein n=2 Tax=Sphingomonas humi TaxID=335630 RepID=A0ABP7RQQ4_9SPHN
MRCLRSVPDVPARIYVDSGSTDGSQDFARSLGFTVLDLELGQGQEFTAARARNLGLAAIADSHPEVRFVHTADGDCELTPGWVQQARETLAADETLAVVFGRRREKYPTRNIYHVACEIEWDVPAGEARSCGGDALFRLAALQSVNGYNPRLIAGEEPDLCLRLRQNGWRIWANGRDMTLHDVDIGSMRQSWRRAMRAGHATAELAALHGRQGDPGWHRFLLSIFFWTGVMALAALLLLGAAAFQSAVFLALGLAVVALLAVQVVRTSGQARRKGFGQGTALKWGLLLFVFKIAQVQGVLIYWARRLTSSRRTLIEYK